MLKDRMIRVAIRLTSPSVAGAGYDLRGILKDPEALAYQEQLRQEQQALIERIEEATGTPLEVKRRFTRSANVISANVRRRDVDVIRGLEGVADVAVERQYRIEPPGADPTATK